MGQFTKNIYFMSRERMNGPQYAPLALYSFRLITYKKVESAESLYRKYRSYEDIDNPPERLVWLRLLHGLFQKDAARICGMRKNLYSVYESGKMEAYDLDAMEKLARFYKVPVQDFLDDYNLFRWKGQGRQLLAYRDRNNLTQKELAGITGFSRNMIYRWEKNKCHMKKETWDTYIRPLFIKDGWPQ